jgi:hypothetical protein
MKPAALLFLLAAPCLAAEKSPYPSELPNGPEANCYCLTVKGLVGQSCVSVGRADISNPSVIRDVSRALASVVGFTAANAFFPPPLTPQQERSREDGRKVMAAAPYLAFPELGDDPRGAPGVCVCSSSVQKEQVDPFALESLKATGKGGCSDLMYCMVKGVPGN